MIQVLKNIFKSKEEKQKQELAKQKPSIFKFWSGSNRERFLLFSIIFGVWCLIRGIEILVPEKYISVLPSNVSLVLFTVLLVLMAIHAAFIFVAQFRKRRQECKLNFNYTPSVDIFIAAHNEAAVIGATLEYMLTLDYPNYKIYAINDRSKDSTSEIMHEVAKQSKGKITVIDRATDAYPGKAAGLNDALVQSKGEVICVFDADARVAKDFLCKTVPYLEDKFTGAVQVQKVISNPERNFLTLCQFHEYAMDTYLQMGRDSIRGSVELRGNGELMTREALVDVGGWNEETLTDDLDLSTSLHVKGWDIKYSPENQVLEEGVPTMGGFIKQRRRWAEGSMRRYLNYFVQLLKPGNLTLNQIFDTFIFLSEFSIPLWLSLDLIFECLRWYQGRETSWTFFMIVNLAMGSILVFAQFNGLRIYKKQKFFEAIFNAVVSIGYLLGTWTMVILITYRKILFSRTVGTWTRTEHGI